MEALEWRPKSGGLRAHLRFLGERDDEVPVERASPLDEHGKVPVVVTKLAHDILHFVQCNGGRPLESPILDLECNLTLVRVAALHAHAKVSRVDCLAVSR